MSSSPPLGSFGDQLLCPVCFEMFEGRILQCSQGHSVCEGCVKKINRNLNHNECPQCRGAFVGTRNYILEEMVKQLKQLKASVMIKKTDKTDTAGTSDQNANKVSNEQDSDGDDIDDAKLTKAIATLVASIPKPSKRDPTTSDLHDSPPRQRQRSESPLPELLLELQPTTSGPPQPRGFFSCRIWNCEDKVPICRMLNHVRTFHKDRLTEHRLQGNDDEFLMHYTFKCKNFRQCIRIAQYGLFFLVVNVHRDENKTTITSWVQCVGRSNECKLFTFNLQMRIGNAIAHFTDYTYGESSEATYIELKKQCLHHETNLPLKRIKDIAVDVKISKSTGERTGRRRTTTTVVPISN
ncbi:uncharacterized protein LOC129567237 isoform X2 [Sitodiplosis mosellana]|uniref:uncharacterized protein LOC129567237 isoform X2 n=1 Tax=Sitodiplosis mosellana TaxID=263140 RepID=UPI002443DFFF|nr:uncharacterized protein LOC129567237 isoform X2 [Sitodiplosis mosellana]